MLIKTPLLAVDAVIRIGDPMHVVLIKRKNPPHGWALPGGFVDVGETVESAVVREAMEETGLDVQIDNLLGVYSEPSRDSRGHTVSIVYVCSAEGNPVGRDDALRAEIFNLHSLPKPLAFDHEKILADYSKKVRKKYL